MLKQSLVRNERLDVMKGFVKRLRNLVYNLE